MTEARVASVAKPKCGIAAALLGAAKALGWRPNWLIGFSSSSSLFGYPGQANYCAANALLDQAAAFGTNGLVRDLESGAPIAAPCPVIAINWGPWGEAGMASA